MSKIKDKKEVVVSVVVPNFNGETYLKKCLESILDSSLKSFEIIVVDDGSSDSSVRIIDKYCRANTKIKLIKNLKNLGAAASKNYGASRASGEILVFLDNDTFILKDTLSNLIQPLLTSGVAATQALLLDGIHKDLIQQAGGILIPHTAWLIPFFVNKRYKDVKKQLTQRSIVAMSGALAVTKKSFAQVKGFDEKEALFTEDLDFSWRMWIMGYKIILAPNSLVYHRAKKTGERIKIDGSLRKLYFHICKNTIRSLLKNYSLSYLLSYLPQALGIIILRGILVWIRRGDTTSIEGSFMAVWWNIINIRDTLSCRLDIQKNRVLDDKVLSKVIFTDKSLVEIYNTYFKKTKLLW